MNRGDSPWKANQLVPINRNGKLEEGYWTYSYSPVRDQAGAVPDTLVVCSGTTESVLSERRLRTLLAITSDSLAQDRLPESQPLLWFAQSIGRMLDDDLLNGPGWHEGASHAPVRIGRGLILLRLGVGTG
jgi:hypothetical protein